MVVSNVVSDLTGVRASSCSLPVSAENAVSNVGIILQDLMHAEMGGMTPVVVEHVTKILLANLTNLLTDAVNDDKPLLATQAGSSCDVSQLTASLSSSLGVSLTNSLGPPVSNNVRETATPLLIEHLTKVRSLALGLLSCVVCLIGVGWSLCADAHGSHLRSAEQ
jgi:hypothetical protein